MVDLKNTFLSFISFFFLSKIYGSMRIIRSATALIFSFLCSEWSGWSGQSNLISLTLGPNASEYIFRVLFAMDYLLNSFVPAFNMSSFI